MSPDDVDSVVLKLYDFLVQTLGANIDEDEDYRALQLWMLNAFDPFYTKDRNYN